MDSDGKFMRGYLKKQVAPGVYSPRYFVFDPHRHVLIFFKSRRKAAAAL